MSSRTWASARAGGGGGGGGGVLSVTSVTFSSSSPTAGQAVTVTCNATGGTAPYTYDIVYGDGQSYSGPSKSVSHVYSTSGGKTVGCAVTDSVGGYTNQTTAYLNVLPGGGSGTCTFVINNAQGARISYDSYDGTLRRGERPAPDLRGLRHELDRELELRQRPDGNREQRQLHVQRHADVLVHGDADVRYLLPGATASTSRHRRGRPSPWWMPIRGRPSRNRQASGRPAPDRA